ncbi:hypothetical protein, partial [Enterobacter hormaechei]|uniref:hypothetical protein n=1 Tax=Enterobacter hormaechei TaxID=158836 RepID=UPI002876CCAB
MSLVLFRSGKKRSVPYSPVISVRPLLFTGERTEELRLGNELNLSLKCRWSAYHLKSWGVGR